jgi:predicted DNA-binding protein with PD1-like motif
VLVGGRRSAKVVVGPKTPDGPLEPQFVEFNDAREIAGVGTIFCQDGKPHLHLPAAIGRGKETLAGCPRGGATVFCVLEVVLIEIDGVDASRQIDPATGLKLLTLGRGK